MNLNISDLLKSVTFDFTNIEKSSIKATEDGNMKNTSIFNAKPQATNKSSKTYEQYSQVATQLMEKLEKALNTWREDKSVLPATNEVVALYNYAVEIQEVAANATDEEKRKLEALANKIFAKCQERDNEVVAYNSQEDHMDHSTKIPNADDLIISSNNATTKEERSKVLEKLNKAKERYNQVLNNNKHPEGNDYLKESIAKVEKRIQELTSKEA